MNEFSYVLDTNSVIYYLNADSCMNDYRNCSFCISDITEIELLSYPKIEKQEEEKIKSFLSTCKTINIDYDVKNEAIFIRRNFKTKLADSIVAASAVVYGLPLITADKGFKKINKLNLELIEPKDLAKC